MSGRPPLPLVLAAAALAAAAAVPARGEVIAEWDFSDGTAHGWEGNARVVSMRPGGGGLAVECRGIDPWLEGPRFDAPDKGLLRVTLTLASPEGGSAQVFYGPTFSAGRQSNFTMAGGGEWRDYTVVLPESTGPGTRLRLDPFPGSGRLTLRRVQVEAIAPAADPPFAPPGTWGEEGVDFRLEAGPLLLELDRSVWNGVRLSVGGTEVARGYDGELIGVVQPSGGGAFLQLRDGRVAVSGRPDGALEALVTIRDQGGAEWRVIRRFSPASPGGSIEVEMSVEVDADREVVLLPWLTLLPGQASFGGRKHQGLFAGVEYLADEPSSSEKDVRGPRHVRRVPPPTDITFPLMAVGHGGRYVGLVWDLHDSSGGSVAAGFDSPDRVFGSEAHAMWLSAPGIGPDRFANALAAHSPVRLEAGKPVATRAVLVGGTSPSVVGALQHYVALRPLPPLPGVAGGFGGAVDLVARGWLDSGINEGWRFRHAVWEGKFGPQPAAGPVAHLSWLSHQTSDPLLAGRLRGAVAQATATLDARDPYLGDVAHVRLPIAPLVFGRVNEYVRQRRRTAFAQLDRFDTEGKVTYRSRPGDPDYSATHFADHANGLGAAVLADALQAALLSADGDLAGRALAVLDRQAGFYANTVPRGAQTWEVPLHTPDILAAAHLVRAYTYGFALTGRGDYLGQAKYWAWTGVPFVYLTNPTPGEVGPYATTAVLGATNWTAPVWIGLPVQWCGLVYASALHGLAKFDPGGPWSHLAKGITRAGLQMTWPATDQERQGLLPDFFHLEAQVPDGPAINPGTVGAHLPEAFGQGTLYDFHRFADGWVAHAPCAISGVHEHDGGVAFELGGWGDEPYHVLVARTPPGLAATSNGADVQGEYDPDQRLLVLPVHGPARVELRPSP